MNVGGRNRVAMAALREVVQGLGHTHVATYMQSGNVAFTGREGDTSRIARALERAIGDRLGARPKQPPPELQGPDGGDGGAECRGAGVLRPQAALAVLPTLRWTRPASGVDILELGRPRQENASLRL
jgi:Protein of unknown function (DUF1697)